MNAAPSIPRRSPLAWGHWWVLVILIFASFSYFSSVGLGQDAAPRLQIVLHVGDHRVFTPLFQKELERESQARIQQSLGIRVEIGRNHPFFREVHEKGLEDGLSRYSTVTGDRIAFVFVDYESGEYRIRLRSYDGWTGLPSTNQLVERTPLRTQVIPILHRLIEADYRPSGSVVAVEKDSVEVRFERTPAKAPLTRWIRPGTILAISQVRQDGPRATGQAMLWAVLEVLEVREDLAKCRYWRRYQEQQLRPKSGAVEYRVTPLPTRNAPAQVRLVDASLQSLDGVHVRFLTADFKKKVDLLSDREGLVRTKEPWPEFAIVQVLVQNQPRVQFPLAVLEGPAPVCVVSLQNPDDRFASLENRRDAWLRRLYENHEFLNTQTASFQKNLSKSVATTLKAVRESQAFVSRELFDLDEEKAYLLREAKAQGLTTKQLDFREGTQRLQELHVRERQLHAMTERLEKVVSAVGVDQGTAGLAEQAKLFERSGDVDRALDLYRQIVLANPNESSIQAYAEKLQTAWKPTSDEHAQARTWLRTTWPELDVKTLDSHLGEAKRSFHICRSANDRLGVVPFARANSVHAAELNKRLNAVKSQNTEDARVEAKAISQTATALGELHAEVLEFLLPRKEKSKDEKD